MKIAYIGYGKMGRAAERMLLARGHETVLVADEYNPLTAASLRESGAEVAVEFTTPATAFDNIRLCLEAGVAVVSGTTGWLAHWDEAVALCKKLGGTMFYASNYSIGVNLLFRLNDYLARMMEGFPQYTPSIVEAHHIHKKDAPSGTAITLSQGIERHGAAQVPIESLREGEVPGMHTVRWKSDVDEITLAHEAFNREGLAAGVAMAAEFLHGRGAGVYSMDDLLK
jgi:4-hydroxy-tetrahydrodipicolinate reductase